MPGGLLETTIRDFGGGWNVSDSDLNLNSKFQPVSDNVIRGVDGSMSVRQGFGLHADFQDGVTDPRTGVTQTWAFTTGSNQITITHTAHGLGTGYHVTLFQLPTFAGIPAEELNGTHAIYVVDANTYRIWVTVAATATTNIVFGPMPVTVDSNMLGGNIIHEQYFNNRLLVFTDIGEVATVDDAGNRVRIWDVGKAQALAGAPAPTKRCKHWSSDTFKSTVIACNGYNRDKPIQIKKDFTVEFLVDKATSSNAAVPKADYVVCLQGYVVFVRTEYGDPFVEMSARGTDGTFTRDPNPADSVEVDLSMVTASVAPVLLGASQIREKLYVAFYDKGMVGELGIYVSTKHNPNFGDTISENGTISHRTMISLGNDILMADYAGVPSVSISQQSGIFMPVRLSELIAPEIQRHLSSLNEETLRYKAWAVYNRNDKTYMLFLPIYDQISYKAAEDAFIFNDELRAKNWALMQTPSHRLFEDSYITIAGATAIGDLAAGNINGKRRVVSIVDDNNIIVELGGAPSSSYTTSGGGTNVTYTPVNDETIAYVFEYNKEFKIRRWTRYRNWNFDCGCSSQRGKVFFGKGLRIYRMGDNEKPVYADFVGEYDRKTWANSTAYTAGLRVRDASDNIVYRCVTAHTSPAAGTFAAYRLANPDVWEVYPGEPIAWAAETPWSDFKQRGKNKINRYINIDSEGTDRFTVSAFTNQIRTDPTTNELRPLASLEFQAGDTGGWGIQNPGNYGGGRRTREEKVWPFNVRGKLIRWRYSGSTTKRVRIIAHTMYYKVGNIR